MCRKFSLSYTFPTCMKSEFNYLSSADFISYTENPSLRLTFEQQNQVSACTRNEINYSSQFMITYFSDRISLASSSSTLRGGYIAKLLSRWRARHPIQYYTIYCVNALWIINLTVKATTIHLTSYIKGDWSATICVYYFTELITACN